MFIGLRTVLPFEMFIFLVNFSAEVFIVHSVYGLWGWGVLMRTSATVHKGSMCNTNHKHRVYSRSSTDYNRILHMFPQVSPAPTMPS